MVQKIKLQTRSYLLKILMDFILQIYISQSRCNDTVKVWWYIF